MIEPKFKRFIKKNYLRLIFLVLVDLIISENGFAAFQWIRDYVRVIWSERGDYIVITTTIHHCSFEIINKHGYLYMCIFEASVDKKNYFKFMEIHTPQPDMSYITKINFKNKLEKASLIFTDNVITPGVGAVWPDHLKSELKVLVPDSRYLAVVGVRWDLKSEFRDVSYIRITGKWSIPGLYPKFFRNVVYSKPTQNALKSNFPNIIPNESEIETVKILNIQRM